MDVNEVVEAVQGSIASSEFNGDFEAQVEGARSENGWWFIPVLLAGKKTVERRFEYYHGFAQLEDFVRQKTKLDVLLIPVISAYLRSA